MVKEQFHNDKLATHKYVHPIIISSVLAGAKHGFDAPEEILEHTHPHWLTFPPVHPFYQHFLAIAFFILWVVCSVSNGLVIYIFLK